MTDTTPAILSIAVLATFALVWGGAWLIRKRRDRTRGILMIVAALVLLGNVLIWTWPVAAATPPSTAVTRGHRVADRLGCTSCHGPALTGTVQIDDPTIATLYSANLSRVVPTYSDRELERTIRTGVRPDDSHLWMMAAAPYAALSAAEMRDLIAFLRSVPPTGDAHPRLQIGRRFLKAAAARRLQPESLTLAHDLAFPAPALAGFERGRYLARTSCGGCHAADLTGIKDPQPGDAPDLAVAAAYSPAAFRTLLQTGKGVGNRDLGVMSEEAPRRFAALSDAEIDAIRAYLVARAKTKT